MAKRGELEKAKAAAETTASIVESKNCNAHDLELIRKTAGSLLQAFSAMTKDEKERLAQRTADAIKKSLNTELGGNWNLIMGKDLQISVGLTPHCRLFRMKSGADRLFCFETYTKIQETDKDISETNKKVLVV